MKPTVTLEGDLDDVADFVALEGVEQVIAVGDNLLIDLLDDVADHVAIAPDLGDYEHVQITDLLTDRTYIANTQQVAGGGAGGYTVNFAAFPEGHPLWGSPFVGMNPPASGGS